MSALHISCRFSSSLKLLPNTSSEASSNDLMTTDLSSSVSHLEMRKSRPKKLSQGPVAMFEGYLRYSALVLLKNKI